jgi:hypothetical protein
MNSSCNDAKKPYKAPKLEVYGDVRQITQTVGSNSVTNDNTVSWPYRTS